MNISPYIQESLSNPAAKVFFSPEDIFFDTKLSFVEKKLLLQHINDAKSGIIHATRR